MRQTGDVHPMSFHCWATVYDAGTTVKRHRVTSRVCWACKLQNTPTRAQARLCTRRGMRRKSLPSRDCPHTNATTDATSDATYNMRRDGRREEQRKCNSFEKDRVAYHARVRRRAETDAKSRW